MTKNLTVGNPILLIIGFATPLFIGNMFQQFYNMADTFIVGRTIGVTALAAVGCTGSISFFILGFVWGFNQGTSIVTAQRFGAGDEAGVRRSFAASILLSAAMTVVLTAVSMSTARNFLILMRTPVEILDAAYSYIIVIYTGIAATVLFNLLSNMMRAVGDSRTPLLFLIIACIINIILDFVFILVFHTGVEGAAYATVIAQVVSGLLCIPMITAKIPVLRIRKEDWYFLRRGAANSAGKELWEHLRVALPVGFQFSIIAVGTVILQFALNGLGTLAVAAFAAAVKIDQMAIMPMSSFGSAMTTFVAQNYGARKPDRIRKGLFQSLGISAAFSVIIGIVFILTGDRFAAIFIEKGSAAIPLAHTYLKINGVCYVLLSSMFICRQSLQGLGNSFVPTISGIMELLMRMFGAIILTRYFGYVGACWAGPLAWLGALVPSFVMVFVKLKWLNRGAIAGRRKQNFFRR
ncbi:MAG: MATE family efflux transporter [Treponema sp.]|jgi:putative MATE family efflux protein|nr:MATE family efflux transporter [Treponema sp.]